MHSLTNWIYAPLTQLDRQFSPHRSMDLIILKFASITSWYGPELSFTITNSNNAQQKRRATYRYASFSLCPFLLVIYFEGETSLAHLIIFCQINFWDSALNYMLVWIPLTQTKHFSMPFLTLSCRRVFGHKVRRKRHLQKTNRS